MSVFERGKTMATFYEILNVQPAATPDEIQGAYRYLATKFHPDKNPGNEPKAAEFFRRIQEAYDVLRDPARRANYDRHNKPAANDAQSSNGWKSVKTGVDLGGVQLNADGTWILFGVQRDRVSDAESIVVPLGHKTHRFRFTNGRWYHRADESAGRSNGQGTSLAGRPASAHQSKHTDTSKNSTASAHPDAGDDDQFTPKHPRRWIFHTALALGAVALISIGLWTQRDNLSAMGIGPASKNTQRPAIQEAISELEETKKQDAALVQLIEDIRKDADIVFRRRQEKTPDDPVARQWFDVRDYTGIDGFTRNAHLQSLNDALDSNDKVDAKKIKEAKDWALAQQRVIARHQKFLETYKQPIQDERQGEIARLNRDHEAEEIARQQRDDNEKKRIREQQRLMTEKQQLLELTARLNEVNDLGSRTLQRSQDFEKEVDTWKDKIEPLFTNPTGAFLGTKEKYIDAFLVIYEKTDRPTKDQGQLIRDRVRELTKPVREALAADEPKFDPPPELKNSVRAELDKIESLVAAYRNPRIQIEGLIEQAKKDSPSSPKLTLEGAIAKRKADDAEKHAELIKQAKSSDVTRLLGPLFVEGYWQPGDGEPKSLELHPISYMRLETFGALDPSVEGLWKLFEVFTDRRDAKRPRRNWSAPRQLPPQIRDELIKVQKYLKELGPTLVELKKLDP
jgi:curved DNA-binding protein CbpA